MKRELSENANLRCTLLLQRQPLEEAKRKAGVTTHEQVTQRLENEGSKCADVATYVRMHKMITVPAEEVPDDIKKQNRKGWIGNEMFRFIDDDGNIATVEINYETISSIRISQNYEDNVKQFVKELKKHEFNIKQSFQDSEYDPILEIVKAHTAKVENELKSQRKKETRF